MRILIVEDETAAYENLLDILREIDPEIQTIGYTESVKQTIQWLKKNKAPDLILMDIHLSDGSAFSIFENYNIETPVIFTTAYDEYAIKAFKVNSVDYILKPVKVEELRCALEKFNKYSQKDIVRNISQIAHVSPLLKYNDKILIPVKDRLQPVNISDIACFYTTEKNTRVFLRDGSSYQYSRTLEQIELSLNPAEFIRANKQYILARNSVKNITIWFDSRLLVKLDVDTPERIYISKNKAAEFKTWMVRNS
jgi:DNA-binding LytR/AlgR family response regulator